MEHTWTKDFYQETDPAKRQQILKEYIGEEEAWEEEYRARLWTARYGQRRLQKLSLIHILAKQGKTIIVVSSEMPEILGITNRIGVMSNGRLAGIVNTKETNQEELLRLSAKYL